MVSLSSTSFLHDCTCTETSQWTGTRLLGNNKADDNLEEEEEEKDNLRTYVRTRRLSVRASLLPSLCKQQVEGSLLYSARLQGR
jgi:hypothetical protein